MPFLEQVPSPGVPLSCYRCTYVGNNVSTRDLPGVGRQVICYACFNDQFFVCPDCMELTAYGGAWSLDDVQYCAGCGESNSYSCDICDNDHHVYSSGCGRRFPLLLHNHSFVPSPLVFHTSVDEPVSLDTLYLGIELEVEPGESDSEKVRKALEYPWLYLKRDASVPDGFEIVTHPVSFSWLNDNRALLCKLLNRLRKLGCKSHDTDTCGLHVHLSKLSFTTMQLYRFMKVIYENTDPVLSLSRRKREHLERWAQLWVDPSPEEVISEKIRNGSIIKYEAVNLRPARTVEVRVFKGTLNPGTFFGCVEFCVALHSFAAVATNETATWKDFMVFAKTNAATYSNMLRMTEKRLEQTIALTPGETV